MLVIFMTCFKNKSLNQKSPQKQSLKIKICFKQNQAHYYMNNIKSEKMQIRLKYIFKMKLFPK